jgi:hypothetical protein
VRIVSVPANAPASMGAASGVTPPPIVTVVVYRG